MGNLARLEAEDGLEVALEVGDGRHGGKHLVVDSLLVGLACLAQRLLRLSHRGGRMGTWTNKTGGGRGGGLHSINQRTVWHGKGWLGRAAVLPPRSPRPLYRPTHPWGAPCTPTYCGGGFEKVSLLLLTLFRFEVAIRDGLREGQRLQVELRPTGSGQFTVRGHVAVSSNTNARQNPRNTYDGKWPGFQTGSGVIYIIHNDKHVIIALSTAHGQTCVDVAMT